MMAQLLQLMSFYGRFLFSFCNIGYIVRRWCWSNQTYSLQGQTWVITGASGGIGRAVVEGALGAGATVIAVARSEQKLLAMKQQLPAQWAAQIDLRVMDLSLQSGVNQLLNQLQQQQIRIDVLVNNVGVLLDDVSITAEGVETSFATNLLNHFQLTQSLLEQSMLSEEAVIINVSSGGMYTVPLNIQRLNIQSDRYNGVQAYSFHKRGQVVLTQYWREKHSNEKRQFYVMHPGWVDTQGVKTSLPRFRQLFKSILRDAKGGADTILWLAGERPQQQHSDAIWFDRKARKAHYLSASKQGNASADELVNYLRSCLINN